MKLLTINHKLKIAAIPLSAAGLAWPGFAFAGIETLFANAFLSIISLIFGIINNIIGTLTGVLLQLAVVIFNWVISPGFISLSYTNAGLNVGDPGYNEFVKVGWSLTRDLTNIIFVIALVIIGIMTALRKSDYQMQRTLPWLIIMALLINFTPIILGLLIDAANIVMNFFMGTGFISGDSFRNMATRQWSSVSTLVEGFREPWDPTSGPKSLAAAAGSFVIILFNITATFVFLFYAFLFILRYLAIWVLVILSPLAFASYILPATRSFWKKWWSEFIKWSVLGIIAAFFLYLSDHFIQIATTTEFIDEANLEEPRLTTGLSPIISNIMPYFIAIALLFIGLFSSMSSAPMGAKAIMAGGERAAKQMGRVMLRVSREGAKAGAKAPFKAFGRFDSARAMGYSRRKAFGEAVFGAGGPKKAWQRWNPIPKERPIETFVTAKKMGFSTTGALTEAFRHWAKPAGPKARAAQKGFEKAVLEVWGAGFKGPKKRKLTEQEKTAGEVEEKT